MSRNCSTDFSIEIQSGVTCPSLISALVWDNIQDPNNSGAGINFAGAGGSFSLIQAGFFGVQVTAITSLANTTSAPFKLNISATYVSVGEFGGVAAFDGLGNYFFDQNSPFSGSVSGDTYVLNPGDAIDIYFAATVGSASLSSSCIGTCVITCLPP